MGTQGLTEGQVAGLVTLAAKGLVKIASQANSRLSLAPAITSAAWIARRANTKQDLDRQRA